MVVDVAIEVAAFEPHKAVHLHAGELSGLNKLPHEPLGDREVLGRLLIGEQSADNRRDLPAAAAMPTSLTRAMSAVFACLSHVGGFVGRLRTVAVRRHLRPGRFHVVHGDTVSHHRHLWE